MDQYQEDPSPPIGEGVPPLQTARAIADFLQFEFSATVTSLEATEGVAELEVSIPAAALEARAGGRHPGTTRRVPT
jgi:hypothetical protein